MKPNVDHDWLRRMADVEDANGGIVSVGGLVTRVALAERLAAAVNAGNGPRAFEEMARGTLDALADMGMVCGACDEPVVTAAVAAQLEMAYRAGQQNPTAGISALPQNVVTNCRAYSNLPPAKRCSVCDWPLADSVKNGCVPGNCAYRPKDDTPEFYRVAERRRQLAPRAEQTPPG